MQCPKCKHVQNTNETECTRCGLIFAKYQARPPREEEPEWPAAHHRVGATLDYLCAPPDEVSRLGFYARLIVYVALFIWGWRFMLQPLESSYAAASFLHMVNLPFHEAGHLFFRPFGQFISSLGGSLGQLLMPLICMAYMLMKSHDTFGASVALWWFAQNFFDLAPYINDARAGELPLLGGNTGHSAPYGFHDWEYLLTETGLLNHDHTLAKLSIGLGILFFVLAWLWGAVILYRCWHDSEAS